MSARESGRIPEFPNSRNPGTPESRNPGLVRAAHALLASAIVSNAAGPVPASSIRWPVRGVRNLAIFLAALGGVAAGIHASRPFPEVPGIYQKYLHFARHQTDYDVLFIGSSRIYHAFIPQQFDLEVAAGSGLKIRSFNLGYDGMSPPETFFVLRKLLEFHPPRLRWVLIDGAPPVSRLDERGRSTRRTAYWHDARHTWLVARLIAAEPLPWPEKWQRWLGHLTHLGNNWTNAGVAAEQLAFVLGSERRKKPTRWLPPRAWAKTEGYEPGAETLLTGGVLGWYQDLVAECARDRAERPISAALQDGFAALIAEIRGAGAEAIIVLTPMLKDPENFVGYPAGVPVWKFQDPTQFPALFDAANHYDHAHLNHPGAQLFTSLVSARFIEHLKEMR